MGPNGRNGASDGPPIQVLLIEDNPQHAYLVESMLSSNGKDSPFTFTCEEELSKGLEHLAEGNTDLILLDLSLPDSEGLDTFLKVQSKRPDIPIVVLTGNDDEEMALEAVRQGAQDYLVKGEVDGRVLSHVMLYAVERKRAEERLRASERRLQLHNKVLVELAKSSNLGTGNLNLALREITKAAAHTLEVEQVAVWLYVQDHKSLRCANVYNKSADVHSEGGQLEAAKYPNYFQALEEGRFIAVDDIGTDERTKEFVESEVSRRGVRALIDCPIRLGGRTVGIIGHRHINGTRTWTFEEQNFAASMADLVSLAMEASERKRVEEQLSQLAYYDLLTGLPNRTLFTDRLNRAMISARQKQSLIAVLFLGLDHFKRINDTLGHSGGDELLKAVADRLTATLRYTTDTVSRIGGDLFVILLSNIMKTEDAIKVTERITGAFKKPFLVDSHEFFLTFSIGISFYPADGRDSTTLLKNADMSMFRAKQQGRNNYQLYSPSMNATALERLVLENSLRHAVERKEFRVHYQPVVDLATDAITGVEALLRWEHPNLGLIAPLQFIPLAEESGLIVPIGEWVLNTVCAQNKAWQSAGFQPVQVSVNLSARQLQQPGLLETIEKALKKARLNPKHLELELTESLIMQNAEASIEILRQVSQMGVTLAIDDFGTGYSSLNYLKRFPIHKLKIDRSFIHDLVTDPDDAAIVKAIISMAHSLKLEVVAESVETKEQLEFLRANGCDKMQGFIFSRPIPAEALAQLLCKHQKVQK